jgi:hypothetical protein
MTSSLPSILCWALGHCKPRYPTIAIPRGTITHHVYIWLAAARHMALEHRFVLIFLPQRTAESGLFRVPIFR